MPICTFISGKPIFGMLFVDGSGCWPNEEVVPINVGGRSCQLKPISSKPSPVAGKKSALKWSVDTPSKKLSRNLDSLSSRSDGPGAGAGGEGKGYTEFVVSYESR